MPNDVTCERLTCECMPELNLYVYGLNRLPPVEYDQTTRLWVCPPGFVCTIDETETGPCPTCGGPPPPVIIPTDEIPEDDGGECWTCAADDADFSGQQKLGYKRLRPTRTIANRAVTATCSNLAVPQEGAASYTIPAGTIRVGWPRIPGNTAQQDLELRGILQLQVDAQALQLAIARLEIDIANGIQQCEETEETGEHVPLAIYLDDDTEVGQFTVQLISATNVDVTVPATSEAATYMIEYVSGGLNDNQNPCPTRRPPLAPGEVEVEWIKYLPGALQFLSSDISFPNEVTRTGSFNPGTGPCYHTLEDLESYLASQIPCEVTDGPSGCHNAFAVKHSIVQDMRFNMIQPSAVTCRTVGIALPGGYEKYLDSVTYRVVRKKRWLRTWPGQLEITNWGTKAADFRPPGEATASVAPAWNGQFITGYQNNLSMDFLGGYTTGSPTQGLQWFGYNPADINATLAASLGGKAMFSPQLDWVGTGTEPGSSNGGQWILTLYANVTPGIKVPFWVGRKNWGTTPLGTYKFFDWSESPYHLLNPAWGKLNEVRAATTDPLPANTRLGSVLTADSVGALPAVDGVILSVGNRICVKDEGNPINNGIYTVTNVGSAVSQWQLTRAADFDTAANPVQGKWFKVTNGASYADKFIQLTTTDPFTINFNAVNFDLIVDDLVVAAL